MRNLPWYDNRLLWKERASAYLQNYSSLQADAIEQTQVRAFADLESVHLVFESNLIEGAGLSMGETQKIASQYFPKLIDKYYDFSAIGKRLSLETLNEVDLRVNIADANSMMPDIQPAFTFAGKSRAFREVTSHFQALNAALRKAAFYGVNMLIHLNSQFVQDALESNLADQFLKVLGARRLPPVPAKPELFTEDFVRSLHLQLAEGLLPADAGVNAGQYRIDNRHVGFDVAFPSPDLVPAAMRLFVERANLALSRVYDGQLNIFEGAARVSHDFVAIHPFPDFNGRVSRLLLQTMLSVCGVPFPVVLRGNKSGRNRYMYALRLADRHHIDAYANLHAMRIVQGFEKIDRILDLAGIHGITDSTQQSGAPFVPKRILWFTPQTFDSNDSRAPQILELVVKMAVELPPPSFQD